MGEETTEISREVEEIRKLTGEDIETIKRKVTHFRLCAEAGLTQDDSDWIKWKLRQLKQRAALRKLLLDALAGLLEEYEYTNEEISDHIVNYILGPESRG